MEYYCLREREATILLDRAIGRLLVREIKRELIHHVFKCSIRLWNITYQCLEIISSLCESERRWNLEVRKFQSTESI